jgi:autoinducer 2-degrading protein
MLVYAVTVRVKPEHIGEFIAATVENARGTRAEPGNLRFDVAQCGDEPGRFLLYEVYLDEASVEAHRASPHYLAWRERVADWMAQPREGIKHTALHPDGADAWRTG